MVCSHRLPPAAQSLSNGGGWCVTGGTAEGGRRRGFAPDPTRALPFDPAKAGPWNPFIGGYEKGAYSDVETSRMAPFSYPPTDRGPGAEALVGSKGKALAGVVRSSRPTGAAPQRFPHPRRPPVTHHPPPA